MAAFGQENGTGLQVLYSPGRGQLGSRLAGGVRKEPPNVSAPQAYPTWPCQHSFSTAVFTSISLSFGENSNKHVLSLRTTGWLPRHPTGRIPSGQPHPWWWIV